MENCYKKEWKIKYFYWLDHKMQTRRGADICALTCIPSQADTSSASVEAG